MSGYRLARTYEEMGFEVDENTIEVKNGKKYATAVARCWKCNGTGKIGCFAHIDDGVCYSCGGCGYEVKHGCRVYTDEERAKLDAQAVRRKERELEKKKAAAPAKIQAWFDKYEIKNRTIYVVAGCNTYDIKDELKEQGAKYYSGINWFFTTTDVNPVKGFLFPVKIDDILYWNEYGDGPWFLENGLDNMKNRIAELIAQMNRAESKSEHIGEVGQRLRNMKATFVSAKFFEGQWGGTFIYTFKVNDNVFTWFTQKMLELDENEEIDLTGTVKSHTEYNGVLQTQLSRCIIKKVGE